jgi:RNA polymerase sigma factor (sigma-70 family)
MEKTLADAQLLCRYADEKSEAAFAELVGRHLDLVYSAALRRLGGDAHRAADVAQQVFTTLARDAANLSRHAVLTAWLYTATRNAAIDLIRSEQRRHTREQEASTMQNLFATTPDAVWEKLRPELDQIMDELSDGDRTAVLLRFFEKRPFADIGAALQLSEDAARMRIDRALEKLRTLLARRGITSTAAALGMVLVNQSVAAAPSGMAGSVASTALAASAAGSTSVATEVLGFMSIKTGLSAVGLLALLAMLGVATYEWRTREKTAQALALVQEEHVKHTADLRAEERRAQTVEQELLQLQKELNESRAAAARTQASAAASQALANWDSKAEGRAFLERHPDVKHALTDYVSASLRFRYAPMYRALALTPEQIQRWETVSGAGTTMGASIGEGRAVSLPYADRPAGQTYSQQLRDAVGDEGMKRMEEFTAIASARGVAADVAGSLYFTDTPLTPDQSDQLVQILVDSRNKGPAARSSEYDWSAVIAKAGAVLAASQVDVLAGRQAGDQFHQALNRPRNGTPTANTGK